MNQPHNCDNFHHNYTILAKIGLGWVQLFKLWDKGARGARGEVFIKTPLTMLNGIIKGVTARKALGLSAR